MKHLMILLFFAMSIYSCQKKDNPADTTNPSDSVNTPNGYGFELSNDTAYTLTTPDSIFIPIDIQQTLNEPLQINMSVSGVPAGVSSKITKTYSTAPFKTTLILFSRAAIPGNYKITVQAKTQWGTQKTSFINLTVISPFNCNCKFASSVDYKPYPVFLCSSPGTLYPVLWSTSNLNSTFYNDLFLESILLKTDSIDQYANMSNAGNSPISLNANCDNNTLSIPVQTVTGWSINTKDSASFVVYGDGDFNYTTKKIHINYTSILNNDTSNFTLRANMK
ncbi:MAG: hypothetical protein H6550_07515 [Chitinophagales bacterium]|nr:hypothetical protein [Chitinophagales bacterium]